MSMDQIANEEDGLATLTYHVFLLIERRTPDVFILLFDTILRLLTDHLHFEGDLCFRMIDYLSKQNETCRKCPQN